MTFHPPLDGHGPWRWLRRSDAPDDGSRGDQRHSTSHRMTTRRQDHLLLRLLLGERRRGCLRLTRAFASGWSSRMATCRRCSNTKQVFGAQPIPWCGRQRVGRFQRRCPAGLQNGLVTQFLTESGASLVVAARMGDGGGKWWPLR